MKTYFLLSAFLLSPMTATYAGDGIVGGERVTSLKEVSYMVSLSQVCGGTIIGSKWILTAAHCAGYFTEAKGGILNLKEEGKTFKIKRVIKHPDYNRFTFSNDFAVAELEEAIDFKKTGLSPIKLADAQFAAEGNEDPGLNSTVYGFGDVGEGESNRDKDLNKVDVPIVSIEEANRSEAYDGRIDQTMLPAGYDGGGKDSCQGDSGGPLIVRDARGTPVQIGVVSWGEGCAAANKYGIYSRVSKGFDWIKKTIAK